MQYVFHLKLRIRELLLVVLRVKGDLDLCIREFFLQGWQPLVRILLWIVQVI